MVAQGELGHERRMEERILHEEGREMRNNGCLVVHQVLWCCQNIKYKEERDGQRGLRVRKGQVL